jgi:hypothetical protein
VTPDFEVGVVEGVGVVESVVSGLLRSEGEGREPTTPSFQTRSTPLDAFNFLFLIICRR